MTEKIAIQGEEGSFHHAAALQYWGENIQLLCCDTFEQVGQSVRDGTAQHGLMAIENSIAGTILQNYRILREQALHISGEVYLKVEHQLLALKGARLEDVLSVESHPMAINQCLQYLHNLDVQLLHTDDTASAAKSIAASSDPSRACIASTLAGQLYGMETLAASIQTHPINYTRFFVLNKDPQERPHNKSSIYLLLRDQKGVLLQVLQAIDRADLNLSKLQSFPAMRELRSYYFHMDLEYNAVDQFDHVLTDIRGLVQEVSVLGSYLRKDKEL